MASIAGYASRNISMTISSFLLVGSFLAGLAMILISVNQ